MYSESIQKLIALFARFPGVGPRVAARFVFYILKASKEDVGVLTKAIQELKTNIKLCSLCFNPFEGETAQCEICLDKSRDTSLLCVVEKESDLEALERIKKYKGLYFILGGNVGSLTKEEIDNIRMKELKKRIENASIKELIIATNPTTEGEATALYIERTLKELNVAMTRLGRGLPIGGELEYADEETLNAALEGRK